MAGVERAGRVGTHELDDDPLPRSGVMAGKPLLPADHHVAQDFVEPGVGQAEVDEARAGHLDPGDVGRRIGLEAGDQFGPEFTGVATGSLRRGQGNVGRPVAVVGVGRPLELHGIGRFDAEASECGPHGLDQDVAHVHGDTGGVGECGARRDAPGDRPLRRC